MERTRHTADDVGMQILTKARTLAETTPDSRNRYVDFLRAFSILVVVFGHWLMAGPEMVAGQLRVGHLISEARWAQWATWLLQVMPIFFFVGGFSNAGSWRSAQRRGTTYATWLRDRLRRLILPVLPVLAVWTGIAAVALQTRLDRGLLTVGSQAALVPVWFLATYVLIVAVVPISLRLWDRFGWSAFAVTAAIAAAIDFANLGMGISPVKWLNYIFVWNAVHFLGYAWVDGRITSIRRSLAIAASGVASLATLVALFPYPLAMVGLDNAAVTNSNPPKVTLIALGAFQFGLTMALAPAARRWLSGIRPWTGVVAINASIMTLYLWHLTAMVGVIGAAYALDGFGLGFDVNSPTWWLTRPLFLLVLITATLPFLALFGRFERPRRDTRPTPPAWKPVVATIAVCGGLGLLARFGVADDAGLNGLALALPFFGVVVGGVVGGSTQTRSLSAAK
ncbi:MAG: acyltransferase [Acidimicrobiia bacterium]|nr:acyltransferase [Acidimicrobiia bacterium]